MISINNQVIFSSHSPITVGKMERKQIKLVKRENGEATISDITVPEVIQELGIRADDILVNKGIIFVEGQDDKAIVEHILNKIHPGASDEINVLITGNCENLKFFANAELLINNKFNIPFLIIRDSDGMNVELRSTELLNDIVKVGRNLSEEQIENIKKSIFIASKYSIEGYFINEILLANTGIEKNLLKNMIRCYECQYNYFCAKAVTNADRQQIANWYQPKHVLENFEDKFKVNEHEAREKHKMRYEAKWKEFDQCISCDANVENFFEGRNELNKYTHEKKLSKEQYLVQLMENYSLDELKMTEFKDLICALETMCSTVY